MVLFRGVLRFIAFQKSALDFFVKHLSRREFLPHCFKYLYSQTPLKRASRGREKTQELCNTFPFEISTKQCQCVKN